MEELQGSNVASAVVNEPTPESALTLWETVVRNVLRKSRGLKPEDHVDLPKGETGKYIRLALDRHGRLSLGKGHGRRQPRKRAHQLAIAKIEGAIFGQRLAKLFTKAQDAAKQAGTEELKPLEAKQVEFAARLSREAAIKLFGRDRKIAAKAARKRHRMARRINFGLVAGKHITHAH